MEWNEYWSIYQDWKYLVTAAFISFVSYACVWFNHKDKCEKEKRAENLRIAIKNTLDSKENP